MFQYCCIFHGEELLFRRSHMDSWYCNSLIKILSTRVSPRSDADFLHYGQSTLQPERVKGSRSWERALPQQPPATGGGGQFRRGFALAKGAAPSITKLNLKWFEQNPAKRNTSILNKTTTKAAEEKPFYTVSQQKVKEQ